MPPSIERTRSQIALMIDPSLASGRNILKGIGSYAHAHALGDLFHCPQGFDKKAHRWLHDSPNRGVIARVTTPAFARFLKETGAPVVDVLGTIPDSGFPVIQVDDEAIAHAAFEHLSERGFRQFAFVGFKGDSVSRGGRNWSERRRYVFSARARRYGCETDVFEFSAQELKKLSWEQREERLMRWLVRLPKPTGLFVCNDDLGLDVLEACRRAHLRVPNEISVVGVDNDESLCEICTTPLSSVCPGHAGVGYAAAALLHKIMRGETAMAAEADRVAPGGVIVRQSSDALAVKDDVVAIALRLIRERSCSGISIDEITRTVGTSRSVLQRRFRTALGQSIHDSIISTRLSRAVELLSTTDMPLPEIAELSGFNHQEYMGVVFRDRLGHTPAQIRRASSSRNASFKPAPPEKRRKAR